MDLKFLKCEHCGNIVAMVKDSSEKIECCKIPMQRIIPGCVEASKEKHIPVYEIKDNIVYVTVGSVEHPMQEIHYIEWILLETKFGNQRKILKPFDKPSACFSICDDDEVISVYAYCNLHGLWKTN